MTAPTLDPTTTDDETDLPLEPTADAPAEPSAPDPTTAGLEDDLPAAPEPLHTGEQPDAKQADGWSKDAMGRWHRPNGTVASKADVEARNAKLATDAAKAAPTPPPVAAVAPPAQNAAPEAPKNLPWTPNIYGQQQEIVKGALVSPDGHVFIPREQVATATALMARGTKYAEVQHQRQQWAQERETLTAPLKHENGTLHTILSNMLDGDWLARAAQDPERAKLEVSNALAAIKIEQLEKFGPNAAPPSVPQAAKAPSSELDQYEAEQAVREEMQAMLQHEQFRDLWTPAEHDRLVERVMQQAPFTVHEGQHALDRLALAQLLHLFAEGPRAAKRVRDEYAAREQSTKAALRNTAAATPAPAAPPAAKSAPPAKGAEDATYADKPWENPKLDAEERRDLFYKQKLKMRPY